MAPASPRRCGSPCRRSPGDIPSKGPASSGRRQRSMDRAGSARSCYPLTTRGSAASVMGIHSRIPASAADEVAPQGTGSFPERPFGNVQPTVGSASGEGLGRAPGPWPRRRRTPMASWRAVGRTCCWRSAGLWPTRVHTSTRVTAPGRGPALNRLSWVAGSDALWEGCRRARWWGDGLAARSDSAWLAIDRLGFVCAWRKHSGEDQ